MYGFPSNQTQVWEQTREWDGGQRPSLIYVLFFPLADRTLLLGNVREILIAPFGTVRQEDGSGPFSLAQWGRNRVSRKF